MWNNNNIYIGEDYDWIETIYRNHAKNRDTELANKKVYYAKNRQQILNNKRDYLAQVTTLRDQVRKLDAKYPNVISNEDRLKLQTAHGCRNKTYLKSLLQKFTDLNY